LISGKRIAAKCDSLLQNRIRRQRPVLNDFLDLLAEGTVQAYLLLVNLFVLIGQDMWSTEDELIEGKEETS
jgi:hypothetical protein